MKKKSKVSKPPQALEKPVKAEVEAPTPVSSFTARPSQVDATPSQSQSGNQFRFDLLGLILIVVLVNAPYLAGRCMPAHDTRYTLGLFDYFYSNYLYRGHLAHWMTYGLYGGDAAGYHLIFMSATSYLGLFLGRLLAVHDSLNLYYLTLCGEQLLFLLGLYLLSRRLFKERLTVFLICLTGVCTIMLQSQIFLNFRLYCMLPLVFYFIIRLRQDEAGWAGWVAGTVAILGPLGITPYFDALWAFAFAVFSVVLFWGRFRSLLAMLRPSPLNFLAATAFLTVTILFLGTLYKSLDNVAFVQADRQGPSGSVSLTTFLTYGGNDLTEMWNALLLPSANVENASGAMGINDYVGLVTMICLPVAIFNLRTQESRAFAAVTVAVFALTRGGILATVIYFFPGMHLFRHVGLITAVLKLLLLGLAGFGLDPLISTVRQRSLTRFATYKILVFSLIGVLLFVDLYVGGPVWANALGKPPPIPLDHASDFIPSALFPLLRGVLLAGLAAAVWTSNRPTAAAVAHSSLPLCFLIVCIAGDCVLYQAEVLSLLHLEQQRISFPALAPGMSAMRADAIPTASAQKLAAWRMAKGSQYQIAVSSALQWDPVKPRFRYDWFPKNVQDMWNVLEENNDSNDLAAICIPKFRLVGSTLRAANNADALAQLGSESGWENRVVLTDPDKVVINSGDTSPMPLGNKLHLEIFEADSLTLHVFNAQTVPIWLVYSDAFDPGWHATVNQKPVPVFEAYAAFKAVRLDPGDCMVTFSYHREIWSTCVTLFAFVAALSSAVGLLALLILGIKEAAFSSAAPENRAMRS